MDSQIKNTIEQQWELLRLCDKRKLQALYQRRGSLPPEEQQRLEKRISAAAAHSLIPAADRLKCEFPEELPITAHIQTIAELLKTNQVVIVCGATGSGKTTQLPKAALAQGLGRLGRIGCTQPRRIAASALAGRLANECACACGQEIGYQVRFDNHTSDQTVIKFMTDGILLAETRNDPDLYQYDCVILDEVHERSLNIDFLLGYMKLLLQRRKDFRLIISSATMESARIADFFGNSPIVEVEGRLFPVEDCFLEPEEEEELADSIARAVDLLSDLDPQGDILVFLPGEREIRDANELLTGRHLRQTEILPLFGRLSAGEQERIFKPGRARRIILSTNVAETSLTIPRIRFVIDSGLVRLSRYNPRSRIQELRVETISQASARQRRGRCGRLLDGVCVHLYSQKDLELATPYTDPEIQRSSLAGVILQMAALHLPKIDAFPFVDPPTSAHIREGLRTLDDLHAIDQNQRLTRTGWALAELPLDPHLGKILLDGIQHKVVAEMIVICSFLSIQDPRERPFEHAKAADEAQRKFLSDQSDFIAILNLWDAIHHEFSPHQSQSALRRFAKKNYLNYRRIREWRNLADDLLSIVREKAPDSSLEFKLESIFSDGIHQALLGGMPRQLAMWNPEKHFYSDLTGKLFSIFPGSGLTKRKTQPKWILFFALMETSRVFARTCSEINPEWLENVAPHLCKRSYDCIAWEEISGFVTARERVSVGQLIIHNGRRCHYGKVDPVNARTVFIREALVSGKATLRHSWLEESAYLISELRSMELRMRRPDGLLDTDALFLHFHSVLPPWICSVDSVKKDWIKTHINYAPDHDSILQEQYDPFFESDFPDRISSGGQVFRVQYSFNPGEHGDGVQLIIPKQKLNLANPFVLEYLVPGYLKWKVDLLFRSLPKSIRKSLTPMAETVDSFMQLYRNGKLFTEQPLADTLRDFLLGQQDVEVPSDAFSNLPLPDYLIMTLAISDENGKILKVVSEFPAASQIGSRLSDSLKPSKQWLLSGWKSWPGMEVMPDSVDLQNDKRAFPALVSEEHGTFGRALFLNHQEARNQHADAVRGLFRSQWPTLIRHLKQSIKLPHPMELSMFLEYSQWKDDLLDSALTAAMQNDLWKIRSAARFDTMAESARNSAAEHLMTRIQLLNKIFLAYEPADKFRRKIPADTATFMDAEAELELLFRPRFLCAWDALQRYPRYFKSLSLRLERAITSSPRKDEEKGKAIAPVLRKIQLAIKDSPRMEQNPDLCELFLLAQEARIAAFTPEIPTLCKCSPAILQRKWEDLRLN